MSPKLSFTLLVAVHIAGCAQTTAYAPELTPMRAQLATLHAGQIDVQVNDLRSEQDGGAMRDVLARQVQAALTPSQNPPAAQRFKLVIDIIEHHSSFTLGNWNAVTRLRAHLFSPNGTALGQWDASGSARRSNMWGYETARAVGQDSYNAAIADLMSALSGASVPQ